ncbi:uncharacterized protein LOC132603283 isoform X2 [Lycium barbarum]|uniref:uncharacterized protein LOC132603283 isoform X2 n=1 Tax=Lycium barbarum TaxID=112863 RepID=UPI00293E3F9A|nr:uncharacterized protein LOC132603283 isoform X2 [Lycium barbarum]
MVLVMEKIFFWCSSRLIGGKSDKLLVIYFYVYMLKVEGIAFRFLPDPVQIKNAMEDVSSSCASKVMLYIHLHVIVSRESKLLKASDVKTGFDGVPVFQSSAKVQDEEDMKNWPWPFQV